MFGSVAQLLCHLIGDYMLQSDWMASEKIKKNGAAVAHVLTYALPFLLLRPTLSALAIIVGSHFLIDRFRLAKYVCYAKNFLAPKWIQPPSDWVRAPCNCHLDPRMKCNLCTYPEPPPKPMIRNHPWRECTATGYGADKPVWMAVWLLIITDNSMHLIFNAAAFWCFPR